MMAYLILLALSVFYYITVLRADSMKKMIRYSFYLCWLACILDVITNYSLPLYMLLFPIYAPISMFPILIIINYLWSIWKK